MLATSQTLNKGRYQIISSFGQDASRSMYEALDTITNTEVVLREIAGLSGRIATPSQVESINAAFAAEASTLAAVEHECLVDVKDHFCEMDRQYLVLEHLTGQDLSKYIAADAAKPALRDVLLWADQLLNGLQYLHKLTPPVIHSSITPENLKLTANLKIKLLTMTASTAAKSAAKGQNTFTDDPAFKYRPLEALWSELNEVTQRVILNSFEEESASVLLKPLDARSDLYSAAAVLYHVLTGQAPVDALERSIAILDGKPDPLRELCEIDAEIAPEISEAFMRGLSIRRENRFESAMIMRQVLRTAVVRAQERMAENAKAQTAPAAAPAPEAVEDPLEIEQRKAEEREREIEAEQARLEEEQRRIEKRKLELDAERERQAAERARIMHEAELEQKRLAREKMELEAAQERQRVTQRLAELEAERERERAEEERLVLEAQEEQRRAEERLQELKREQERHRAEQKRLELEAKKELELAEERIKELSGFDLDLETTLEPQTDEPALLDLTGLSADEPRSPFDADEPGAVETQVPHFHEQPGINLRIPAIVGGATAMLAIAVWVSMTMFATSTSSHPSAQQAALPVVEQPRSQPIEAAPVIQTEVPAPETQASVETPRIPDEPVSTDDEPAQQKRLQTAAVQSRPRRPAAEKPSPAKPKVTVDDLINDN